MAWCAQMVGMDPTNVPGSTYNTIHGNVSGRVFQVGSISLTISDRAARDNEATLNVLANAQVYADGWESIEERLTEYLAAMRRSMVDHPYPGVVPGTPPPPL